MIVEKILEHKQAKIRQFPARSNRASEIGHPCALYLTFCRTNWQDRKPPDGRLQMIFDLGNDVEARVIRDMQDAGITVIEQQRAFDWAEYQITGTVDCKVVLNGSATPCEIKSASPFAFEKVNSVEDMLKSKYVYMRKYPAQLALYCLMSNIDHGLFLFKNKSTGAMKEIPLEVDFEYAEGILKRLEIVNANIAAGTKPQPIDYDESICGDCPFLHICPVLRSGQEIEVVDDTELAEMIAKWDSLKDCKKEFDEIDGVLKQRLEGVDKKVIGEYFVCGQWRKSTTYDIPKEVKEPYKKESQWWMRKIAKI